MLHLSGIFLVLSLTLIPDVYSDVPRAGPEDLAKIIGGQETTIEKYPFIVALYLKYPRGFYLWCGGSLVKEDWVLTAAHCLLRSHEEKTFFAYDTVIKAKRYRIVAGQTLLDTGLPAAPAHRRRRVIETHPNKYYNPTTKNDDIGLMRLASGFATGSSTIQLVRLPTSPATYDGLVPESCTVAGWGMTNRRVDARASKPLKDVELEVLGHDKCQEKYGGIWWGKAIDGGSQMCTESELDGDVFKGDSGGPLVIEGYQMGIVSFGANDSDKEKHRRPAVFTRVDFYLDWIEGTIAAATPLRPRPRWSAILLSCSAHGLTMVVARMWL